MPQSEASQNDTVRGTSVRDGLAAIARLAGAELRRRFELPRSIEKKGATDLVTDADRASEALVVEALRDTFPGAEILAEESGRHAGTGGLRFVVDPLDGTTNYAHGIPLFSVTLAAMDDAGVLAGVVFDPLKDELFAASRGGGAWLGERRLSVSKAPSLSEAVVATGFPYDWTSRAEKVLGLFGDVAVRARGMRRFGSAAIDLAWVAAGRFDAYFERGLKPWDVAAGILLVQEAGGVVSLYSGESADPFAGEALAAGAPVHAELLPFTRARS